MNCYDALSWIGKAPMDFDVIEPLGDGSADNEYATKGTDPSRSDTDQDGVRDDKDLAPLGDAFVEVRIDSRRPPREGERHWKGYIPGSV